MPKFKTLTSEKLTKAGEEVIRLFTEKRFAPILNRRYEKSIQLVLLGYLQSSVGSMKLEYPISQESIDFRYGGDHPSLVELVTISHSGYNVEHNANRNMSELKKLSKFDRSKARVKYLLILDFLNASPIKKQKLQDAYCKAWRKLAALLRISGRNVMYSVTVLYVHPLQTHRVVLPRKILRPKLYHQLIRH
jgi:hypothetical protein